MGLPFISGFDILDLSGNRWENINFQIEDYENDRIAFYCAGIEILNVHKPTERKQSNNIL
ncbi:hypothetical protein [Myroides odoratus]|uniref:hypothetical protein n=1 Tax=Myroides odoratus TaxID=256 RepID=UPI0039B04177